MKQFVSLIVCVACAAFASAPVLADAPLAPSAVVAAAATYDTQTITVSGTVKDVKTRSGRRGTITQYQLCDTACLNVVQFGDDSTAPPVAEGQTQTVTGRFRASVERGPMKAQNVLMVGTFHHGP
ncbi:MAG TPA: hypothetical protein VMA98_13875 [Candidatus Acidoferrales bacterium]|nr:hypothetical protein [Candidatus Acidoferrales bacterium]